MVGDKYAALRERLNEPEPEVFKFENAGDELVGEVRSLALITFKDRQLWQLVLDYAGPWKDDGTPGRVVKILLTQDLEDKLIRQREVRPGDIVAIRFLEERGNSGFKVFKVAVDPERPLDAVPLPDGPSDDEPPF